MFIPDRVDCWKHGIWFHRNMVPAEALGKRGHGVKQVAMGTKFTDEQMDWPDTVIFGRTYPAHLDPISWMKEFKKRGKRVLYDMDDDFWQVSKDNPSVLVSNALKDQYEGQIEVADAVITPSKVLAKKFKKYFKKPVFIAPNCAPAGVYQPRPRNGGPLTIGYMGAASHWKDLQLIGEVVSKLSEKYDFIFKIYGLVGEPLEAAMYAYRRALADNMTPESNEYFRAALKFDEQVKHLANHGRLWHIPFMPPELHPTALSACDFDIGLAPLEETVFNNGKSCIKFYEYASVGTVTLASNVLPYSDEVNYTAKNTFKDWYNKLEKLIVDEKFREKILKEQMEWVAKNRSLEAVGVEWEKACQKPGGAPVANQS